MPGFLPAGVHPRVGWTAAMGLASCPEPGCGAPAEILDGAAVHSTGGPVELVRTQCLWRHIFVLPADRVDARSR